LRQPFYTFTLGSSINLLISAEASKL
jgi:hypothetical protein